MKEEAPVAKAPEHECEDLGFESLLCICNPRTRESESEGSSMKQPVHLTYKVSSGPVRAT